MKIQSIHLLDFWGDIEHDLFGLTNMKDINKLHVNEGYIEKQVKELQAVAKSNRDI
jgi:hypothetical protein